MELDEAEIERWANDAFPLKKNGAGTQRHVGLPRRIRLTLNSIVRRTYAP